MTLQILDNIEPKNLERTIAVGSTM